MMTNDVSLYVHIPFCERKCRYCAFYSLTNQSDEIKEEYFQASLRQMRLLTFEGDFKVPSVYFGGGTPPVLGIERLCQLAEYVQGNFTLYDDCEITVEVNPGTIDRKGLERLYKAGVNRLSVGVQSSDNRILAELGRIHTFEDAKQCIEDAKAVGFDNISADIMFALPNQSSDDLRNSVLDIMSTGVKHISAYSLQLEEGTPLWKDYKDIDFIDEDTEESQYDELCFLLKSNGFEHYEVSSFAKSGCYSRHNMRYWTLGQYFGCGAGAHSYVEQTRMHSVYNIKTFIEKSHLNAFQPIPYEDMTKIPPEETEEEIIMLGLRTYLGAKIPEKVYSEAERIAKMGYGTFENGVLKLNSKGFRVSNEIIWRITDNL